MFFKYKALKNNKIVEGKIESHSTTDVVNYLRTNDFFPINIAPIEDHSTLNNLFVKVGFNDIVDFTRQLAIMLNAGLTLIDCFDILKKQTTNFALLKMIKDIDKDIRGGQTLSSALLKYKGSFSNLYIALVRSGEASGKLSEILLKLADNLEKQREFKGKIKGALIYPAIVVIGMVVVMFIMVTFVVPKLLVLYQDFNVELPMSTKILMFVSDFCVRFWPVIVVSVFVGVNALKAYIKTKQGKLQYDRMLFKLPVLGNIIKISSLVDATRTLSILISSGVSILDGLQIIMETSDNMVYQIAFQNIYKQVEKGLSLGKAMANEKVFPPILIQMTTVGEQTGHLDDTLGRLSKYFEMESEIATKTMTTLIEPLILVFLGLGVGFLVTSVITPIYNLTSSFK
ncbi:hypothetical protein AUK04_01895 [Candidatus Roizmanbacteria bacterium CG2_30_33_16]|uniref:Type II secretion system protein GspF domain-containing protein n=5 Tax=Candidatus Roizmaniibacteriota TaxID=1752723 RepID=A0A1J5HIB4_9BACT|nr:MAG: hypothetical protein AUK04_01895 [Candidatus Roizmanbacteria bacterium CG2_30_33_16]